jgi:hypothetical protein
VDSDEVRPIRGYCPAAFIVRVFMHVWISVFVEVSLSLNYCQEQLYMPDGLDTDEVYTAARK